jgi:hypothetical protein
LIDNMITWRTAILRFLGLFLRGRLEDAARISF